MTRASHPDSCYSFLSLFQRDAGAANEKDISQPVNQSANILTRPQIEEVSPSTYDMNTVFFILRTGPSLVACLEIPLQQPDVVGKKASR